MLLLLYVIISVSFYVFFISFFIMLSKGYSILLLMYMYLFNVSLVDTLVFQIILSITYIFFEHYHCHIIYHFNFFFLTKLS